MSEGHGTLLGKKWMKGGAGMKVPPYHSSNPSDPDVYHDHDDCVSGQQIPWWNKVSGTGNQRKCEHCSGMK